MSTLLSRTDSPGDAELIAAVRGGDVDAYGELFARHVEAARRLARQLVRGADAEDLVSDAFAKVLGVLQRGGGPDLAFRAYLLTAVRRLHVDRVRAQKRVHTTDDLTPFDPGVPFRDTAIEGFESSAAAKAFASLPERWQLVLWHTEVEGQKPAEIAPLLGMTANSVSALAYRAREGLRQAFLGMHVQELDDADCEWTHQHLGPFVRGGLSKRDASKVTDHLADCRRCTVIYLELTEVNSSLSAIIAPLVLGSAAAAYVTGGAGLLKGGGLLLLAGRARDLVVGHATASAVAGVAATAVVGGLVLVSIHQAAPAPGSTQAGQPTGAGPAVVAPHRRAPAHRPDHRPDQGRRQHDASPGGPLSVLTPALPGTPASAGTSSGPVEQPTRPAPGDDGVDQPSQPSQPAQPGQPGQPSQPTQPPPGLGAAISVTRHADGTYLVALSVTGASDAGTATVEVTGDTGTAVVTHDVRCAMSGPASGVCDLAATPALLLFSTRDSSTSDSSTGDGGGMRFVVRDADGVRRTLQVSLR